MKTTDYLFSTEEIYKLPKWAQIKLHTLQMRFEEAHKEINQLKDAPESNTVVGDGFKNYDDHVFQYLKNNQPVTFILADGSITVRVKDSMLDVHNYASDHNKYLCVYPDVSNGISIALTSKP